MESLLNKDGLTQEEFLASYKPGNYDRPSNTVDMLIFTVTEKKVEDLRKDTQKELKILLIKRNNHPYMHRWALPGGFVNMKENLSVAAARELEEETNVSGVYMEQLYTYGDIGRDPRMRVISIAYMALVPDESLTPIAGDDAEDVAWFYVRKEDVSRTEQRIIIGNDDLDILYEYKVNISYKKNGIIDVPIIGINAINGTDGVAFDHIYMINDGIDRLRNKISYVPIAFNLVPKKFTLNEIQQVYEVIFGRSLTKQNFRKWIDKYVVELDEKQSTVGHRPAKLFRYKEEQEYEK